MPPVDAPPLPARPPLPVAPPDPEPCPESGGDGVWPASVNDAGSSTPSFRLSPVAHAARANDATHVILRVRRISFTQSEPLV
jgi:hypothetical protein